MLGAYISNYVEQYWKTISKKLGKLLERLFGLILSFYVQSAGNLFFLKAASTIKRQVSLI